MSSLLCLSCGPDPLGAGLRERTPSANVAAVAELPGHVLRRHQAGADGWRKCDVVAADAPPDRVPGSLYRLALHEPARPPA